MFDDIGGVTTGDLDALVTALARLDEHVDDGERIDQLTALERVKSAVAAAQARVTVGFVSAQEQIAQGWREHAKACSENNDFDGWATGSGRRCRQRRQLTHGITAQVALARHESPHRGSGHVNLALTLSRHLPHVFAWLQTGVLSEWRATLIVPEAADQRPGPHRDGPGAAPGSLRSVTGAGQQDQPSVAARRRPRIGRPTPPPPLPVGGACVGESGIGDGHPRLNRACAHDLAVDALRRERRRAHC